MHIALLHNVSAGDHEYEPEDLVQLMRAAGHEVTEFGKRMRDVAEAVALYPDLIAVAGGDGTVAKAVRGLVDSSLPLLLLPTGTANNIARSLGVVGPIPEIIRALPSMHTVRLDVGRATGPWGEKAFVESAGVGFVATMLRGGKAPRARLERFIKTVGRRTEHRVRGASGGVARLIGRYESRHYDVRADGDDLSGEYLAVEAMNIRTIGPRLPLAPDANVGDALIDLVLVRPEGRDALIHYIRTGGESADFPPTLLRRVRSAQISWPEGDGHVDDKPWPRAKVSGRVTVEICGGVSVLVPMARSAAAHEPEDGDVVAEHTA